MILPVWFDHLEESYYSYKKVQFKTFCPAVKTSYPPAENVNETLVKCYFSLDIFTSPPSEPKCGKE